MNFTVPAKEVHVRFCKDWSQLHYLVDMNLFSMYCPEKKNKDCTKIPGSSSHVYVNGYVIPQKEMVPLNDKDLISLGGNHTVDEVQGEKRLFVYRLIILRKSLL